jgi:hypothetical protein
MKYVIIIFAALSLAACAHNDLYQSDIRASGPRVVALQAPRLPWVMQVERRLRDAGFEVRRFESTQTLTEADGPGRVTTYNEASAPYILRLEGAAGLSNMRRCFGGGFNFEYISAELIDVRSNQTLATYSGQGYSEGCPPMSGKLFTNITNMVANAWGR